MCKIVKTRSFCSAEKKVLISRKSHKTFKKVKATSPKFMSVYRVDFSPWALCLTHASAVMRVMCINVLF